MSRATPKTAPARLPPRRASTGGHDFALEERPDAYEAETALLLGDPAEQAAEEAQAVGFLRRGALGWGGLLASSLGGLIVFSFGLWLDQLIESLFARSAALGYIGLGLAGLAAAGACRADRPRGARDFPSAPRRLAAQGAGAGPCDRRPRSGAGEDRRTRRDLPGQAGDGGGPRPSARICAGEIVDGRDLVEIAERELMPPLDAAARQEVATAAKRGVAGGGDQPARLDRPDRRRQPRPCA